jgi:hypothetical protein
MWYVISQHGKTDTKFRFRLRKLFPIVQAGGPTVLPQKDVKITDLMRAAGLPEAVFNHIPSQEAMLETVVVIANVVSWNLPKHNKGLGKAPSKKSEPH